MKGGVCICLIYGVFATELSSDGFNVCFFRSKLGCADHVGKPIEDFEGTQEAFV